MANKIFHRTSKLLFQFQRPASLSRSFHFGKDDNRNKSYQSKWKKGGILTGTAALALLFYKINENKLYSKVYAKDLPVYTADEVLTHSKRDTGVWVTYKDGVYDITEFLDSHPGGDKIMLSAGGPIDPFWNMYAFHKDPEIIKMLDPYLIGRLCPEDLSKKKATKMNDPFANEPMRLPLFRINSKKPFNAEPPPKVLADSFITPNELFYIRNHLPVPQIDPETFKIEVVVGENKLKLSLEDLKTKYKPVTITTTIQCAGNRREEMSREKTVKGLSWGLCAISTARWTGVRLKEVLADAGLDPSDKCIKHIHFNGLDADMTKSSYGASIPKNKALSEDDDVILAYQMNGVDIPRDHGYPVRVIVPGCVGARNVKWLHQIVASDVESFSFWQRNDYKGFSPSTTFETADYNKAVSIQELPVVSAITSPSDEEELEADDSIEVKGYAWSGGGRDIIRVEVSSDGGISWKEAKLMKNPEADDSSKNWAWTLWKAEMPVEGSDIQLMCRAIDSSFNCQPENASSIWNLRGFMMNSWHRINVKMFEEE